MPKNKDKESIINDHNIQDRVKNILLNTLNDSKSENNLNNETMELLDKLFELFPELKNENKHLIKKKSLHNIINEKDLNEIVLDEFKIKDKVYYRDQNGGIWNQDAQLIGIIKNYDQAGDPICIFFDDKKEIDTDINNLLGK